MVQSTPEFRKFYKFHKKIIFVQKRNYTVR